MGPAGMVGLTAAGAEARLRRGEAVLGRYGDALVSVGLDLINPALSAVQEIRAEPQLDRLRLLDRAAVIVMRDGRETGVAADAVVQGDVLRVRAAGASAASWT
ncbi:hypothetical protein [Actinoplanes sp. NPDC049681]|uniref:hypothetical protein n=1 Tax=Actinoplanes sp. NPDC049681 TaxID=3363905 RepID=UPI0037B34283